VVSELRRPADDGAGRPPVDAVLPWCRSAVVLTMPYRLRYQMAWNHGLSRAVLGVYAARWATVYARAPGSAALRVADGMVTALQRAGGAVEHERPFHTLVLDGVVHRSARGALAFHPAPGPSDAEVAAALATIRQRVQQLLVRHGPGAGRRGDGAGGSAGGRVPGAGGDRRGLGARRVALGCRAGARVRRLATRATRRP